MIPAVPAPGRNDAGRVRRIAEMTLDIKIGKLVQLEEGYTHDNVMDGLNPDHSYVEVCPESNEDVCDPEHTIYPKSAYRSGGYGSFPGFIRVYLPRMYQELGVSGIARLSRYYPEIMVMPDGADKSGYKNGLDKDRIHWFKHWSKVATDLYGDDAGVMFS